MSYIEITKLRKPVTVTIEIPPSKSYTNRALIMAALTKGPVTLHNPLYSDDTEAMIACLRTLGLGIDTWSDHLLVSDDITVIGERYYELFTQDSGTTIRFLLALLCLIPGIKVIRGSKRLNERPIKDLVDALRQLGAEIRYLEGEGQPPIEVGSSLLHGGKVTLDASVSSQFFSALLMIAPLLNGLKIQLNGAMISKSYINMTISAMREWGVDVVQNIEGSYHIPSQQSYMKKDYVIEGDFSSAGYFLAIGALTQSTITLKNLNPRSAQGDRKFLDILERMGNNVILRDDKITIIGRQILPMSLDMEDCPDQVQTMAVLAAFAKGVTTISGVRSLRVKETERVQALKNELAKMGIKTKDTFDEITIYGGDPHAATIDTYGDHRMAMAFAVAGTMLSGMKINNPEVVNKTFPRFWDTLRML